MSWKKNVFSFFVWFVYASLVTAALVSLGSLYCQKNGIALYWGILFVVLYIGLVGGIVFLLRKLVLKGASFAGKGRGVLLMAEFAMVVVFLALGIVFRGRGMEGIIQSSEYYETAKIVAGQGIPQIVHGAVYFYVQVLREAFYLLGNHLIAGIWLQVALQLLGSLFLFFAVRKLAGRIAALTVFGFCMCAPYQVQEALVLSPEMLYFCIFTLSALLIAAGKQEGKKPVLLFLTSVLAAVCCYIDVIGILLLFLVLLVVLYEGRGETGFEWKKEPFLFGLAALVLFILGFLLCVFSDAFFSGKSFEGVFGAWLRLYYPGSFQIPVTIGGSGYETENIVLFGIMAFGVFSFWCDRKRERISPCIAVTGLLVLGMCYGILREEMPGFHYLYLLLTLLAGIGLGQCFCPASAVETEKKESTEGDTAEASVKKDDGEEEPKEVEKKTEEETKPESEEKPKEETKSEVEEKPKEAVEPATEEKPKGEEKTGTEGETMAIAEPGTKNELKASSEREAVEEISKEEPKSKIAGMPGEEIKTIAEDGTKNVTDPEAKVKSEAAVGLEDREVKSKEESELETGEMPKEAIEPENIEQPREEMAKTAMEAQDEEKPGKPEAKAREISEELEREKALKEEFRQEAARRKEEQELEEGKKQVKYIENPLPLPKKHIKRVMEYTKQIPEGDDFDHPVSENDDFDI